MVYIAKYIISIIIPMLLQVGIINSVETTPVGVAKEFMGSFKNERIDMLNKHVDNRYINYMINIKGDEEIKKRLREALFQNYSFEIRRIGSKDDVAVAEVAVKNSDFQTIMKDYDAVSHDYIVNNLHNENIADKEFLKKECMRLYVEEMEKTAAREETLESVVYLPMVQNQYHGWDVWVTDEVMEAVFGYIEIPTEQE